ncbi:hypothetical protein PFLmoz3_04484 [Pseudomonas fluorescens]|uniref:Uncharacterized protein n=1 Tax=Pseudomonas fluorescens TaxID=294 RepID=A0A120G6N4_PSEFL|nr:hypothetical protein PFLmoz3_04484 [Pseudomonas fluorescens]
MSPTVPDNRAWAISWGENQPMRTMLLFSLMSPMPIRAISARRARSRVERTVSLLISTPRSSGLATSAGAYRLSLSPPKRRARRRQMWSGFMYSPALSEPPMAHTKVQLRVTGRNTLSATAPTLRPMPTATIIPSLRVLLR